MPQKGEHQNRIREVVTRVRHQQAIGQAAPDATTNTTLYTCPKQRLAKGRIFWCERGGGTPTYRIAVRAAGATLANAHYIVYDRAMAANEADETEEIQLSADDVITVYASTANTSFSFIGYTEPKDT